MNLLVRLAFLFATIFVQAQDFTIVQINARWNERNKVDLPFRIEGAKVVYGYLEDQSESLRKRVKSVPVILVYKGSDPIGQFTAGVDLKLNVTKEEIAALIRKNKI